MPPKKSKKPRVRRSPSKKNKGLKQKQKQRQVVNVQVSSGGGGSGGFIPIPQAPEINYSLLSQMLRPAATVDVPIRAAAPIAESIATRPAETQTLAEDLPMRGGVTFEGFPVPFGPPKARKVGSGRKPKTVVAVESEPESGSEYQRMIEAQKMGGGGGFMSE